MKIILLRPQQHYCRVLREIPFLVIVTVGGFLAGYIIMPRVLKSDIFSIRRAIAAGCLTTLASTFFFTLLLVLLSASGLHKIWQLPLEQILDTDLTFSYRIFRRQFPISLILALVIAIPYSFIGAPATVLLSHRFVKHRAKEPKFDLETFE